ncbi:MAG: hypothetical protein M3Q34_02650 [bacterium]|nr:hypothetical protein [bacterium]
MKNKILLSFLAIAFVFSFAFISNVSAQSVSTTFPAGCTSGLGYSVSNGVACNGTATAVMSVPGCTTALGYSTTSPNVPCSGTSVALNYLAGCSSINGYSTVNGVACNGTATASVASGTLPNGCSSMFGYSTVNGVPCNGTSVATPAPGSVAGVDGSSPGLPTTGSEGNIPLAIAILLSASLIAVSGSYLLRGFYRD